MAATQRAWHAGDETFRDRLLAWVKKGGKEWRNWGRHSGKALAALVRARTAISNEWVAG